MVYIRAKTSAHGIFSMCLDSNLGTQDAHQEYFQYLTGKLQNVSYRYGDYIQVASICAHPIIKSRLSIYTSTLKKLGIFN